MKTFAWEYGPLYFWLTLSILIVVFGLVGFAFFKVCRRKSAFVTLIVTFVVMMVSFIFNLFYVAIITGAVFTCATTICLFANLGDLRSFIGNPFKKTSA